MLSVAANGAGTPRVSLLRRVGTRGGEWLKFTTDAYRSTGPGKSEGRHGTHCLDSSTLSWMTRLSGRVNHGSSWGLNGLSRGRYSSCSTPDLSRWAPNLQFRVLQLLQYPKLNVTTAHYKPVRN